MVFSITTVELLSRGYPGEANKTLSPSFFFLQRVLELPGSSESIIEGYSTLPY